MTNKTTRVRADVLAQALCCDEGFLIKRIPALGEIEDGSLYFEVDEALFNALERIHEQQQFFHSLIERKEEIKKKLAMYRN